jgi:S1-C subfamily serine protease
MGALVGTVTGSSPAERAGLRTGDLIVAIDGQVVEDPNAFDYRFVTKALGGQAQIGVLRSGREVRIAVALESAPESPRDELVIRGRSPFTGSKIANLSPAVAEEMRLDAAMQGVVIVEIASGSAAERVGLQRGDVVLAVNGEKIGRTRDLDRMVAQPSRLWRITIMRDGQTLSVTFAG